MPRIIIADDHHLVRAGIKQIISLQPGFDITEVENGNEVLKLLNEAVYDLVMLDISMPGRSGIEILKEIKSRNPKQQVLVLSIYPEEQYALRALKAGASGYLNKDIAPEELLNAIRKILNGEKYISPAIAAKLVEELDDKRKNKMPHERLSDREYEIFCKIGDGKTISQIAVELFISVKTVSTYRSRILLKSGMKNNAEIMKYVIENSLNR